MCMVGDRRVMYPGASLMFHYSTLVHNNKKLVPSSGLSSIEWESYLEDKATWKSVEVHKLLTTEHWSKMEQGEDIYLSGVYFNARKDLLSW